MTEETVLENRGESASPRTIKNPHHHRNRMLWLVTAFLLVVGIVFLLLYLLYFRHRESTDDAYANGNMIMVTPVVHGPVAAFYADNTDLVVEGQLLVEIDNTAYLLAYEEEIANLAATVLNVRQLYADVATCQAILESKLVLLSRARYDYENREKLIDSEAVSQEDYTHAKEDVALAIIAVEQATAQLLSAQAAAGNTPIENHPLLEQAKAQVHKAYYNLCHCAIYAPSTGYIAQRAVNVGQSVNEQTPLMAIIPTDYVWVDANFKETQLKQMRIGQEATTTFDLYGSDVVYKGKVLGIASGSGSVFSLIPPQNATGNWIKVVQRLPVRISLDPEQLKKHPARIGISASVEVDISNQHLPILAKEPSKSPVDKTEVLTIDYEEINALIEQVIEANLRPNF